MLDIANDIRSLSDFKRNTSELLEHLKKTGVCRVFFTVDETAKVVQVVHIRRGARQRPAPGDLKGD